MPVRDAGYRAVDGLSAEKGGLRWGADVSGQDTPMEAGIEFVVSDKLKTEIDFLGREALLAKKEEGLQRKLVCLTVESDASDGTPVVLSGLETIRLNGKSVGVVQSTAFGHTVKKTVAYGYVEKQRGWEKVTDELLMEGTWKIGDRGKELEATLRIGAVFDEEGLRVHGKYGEEVRMGKKKKPKSSGGAEWKESKERGFGWAYQIGGRGARVQSDEADGGAGLLWGRGKHTRAVGSRRERGAREEKKENEGEEEKEEKEESGEEEEEVEEDEKKKKKK